MQKFTFIILALSICISQTELSAQNKYTADWQSLDQRPVPEWFSQAKFGIFIHWGVYSVPAYRNFSGAGFEYRDLAPLFHAELWNPDEWADLFARSGAKYVVLTAKHHDGYCLWDTQDTLSRNWNSMETGPHRDIVGELSMAVERKEMKFGISYSLLEWEPTKTSRPYDERYASERSEYYFADSVRVAYPINDSAYIEHVQSQLKELVRKYSPDIIYADGASDYPDSYWKSTEFISWLYNNAANKRNVVVNDRWGNNTREIHGDYFTGGYSGADLTQGKAWEECRGIGDSFGYKRNEALEDYKSARELITLLCKTVSSGGNLLLNVGPKADGRIPLIQQERLLEIGKWLDVNGHAIFRSEAYHIGDPIYTATRKGNNIYIFKYEWTQGSIKISLPEEIKIKNCILLGHDKKLVWKQQGPDLLIIPPVVSPDNEMIKYVYVFQITTE